MLIDRTEALLGELTPQMRQRLHQLDVLGQSDAWRGSACALPRLSAAPTAQAAYDFDVALLGGGLSLLVAPLLARQGLSVVVIERAVPGVVHREWNASAQELQVLVQTGLVTAARLEALIVNRYQTGLCRWHGGGTYRVQGVLDCALDAGALLADARDAAIAAGVTLWQHAWAGGEQAGPHGVAIGLWPDMPAAPNEAAKQVINVRVMLDGRGVQSPYACADLMCPTVGGVLEGLDEGDGPKQVNNKIGEILVTTDDVAQGRQHLWEGFPGREGLTTVYLFYYARRQDVPVAALTSLYRRFIHHLGDYKTGRARLVRPTFGFIPGWSRLTPPPRAPHVNIILMGDAAARQSPLTFCGFGAMLRSLTGVCDAVVARVANKRCAPVAVDDAAVHAATGALTRLMAQPSTRQPQRLNALLDAAFKTLHAMGNDDFAALLQDRMRLETFVRFLYRTSRIHPGVWQDVREGLGILTSARWGAKLTGHILKSRLTHMRSTQLRLAP